MHYILAHGTSNFSTFGMLGFIFGIIAMGYAQTNLSRIKLLEKRIELLRKNVKINDLDMISNDIKKQVGNVKESKIIKLIKKELGIEKKEAIELYKQL